VRVPVEDFVLSRSFRRIMARNDDLCGTILPNEPTGEQYGLFRAYLEARHGDGGMVDMSVLDFAMMVEDSHVTTRLIEYRGRRNSPRAGDLVGVALTDVLADGLSMVYSFYDPDEAGRSLGSFMILDHIAKARLLKLPYLYLGYWVEGSKKMDYKGRFLPQERLGMLAWERVEKE
jgi:arginine-tRNA-protein transferase